MEYKYYWDISGSPKSSPFVEASIRFGTENALYLIDPYDGKMPILMHKDYFGKLRYETYPVARLDSNVLSALSQYIKDNKRPDIHSFLTFITEQHWDIDPMFYYMEQFAKDPVQFEAYAIPRTKDWLFVRAMDQANFLKTGEIVQSKDAEDYYVEQFGGIPYEEIPAKIESFKELQLEQKEAFDHISLASKASLLKTVLINHFEMPSEKESKKLKELDDFHRFHFGASFAREMILATNYFFGMYSKLFGIQKSTPYEKAIDTIASTSWDLFLVRYPEFHFNFSGDEHSFSYIATKEKRLAEYANQCVYQRIFILEDGTARPEIAANFGSFSPKQQIELDVFMNKQPYINSAPPSLDHLCFLVSQLEKELKKKLPL